MSIHRPQPPKTLNFLAESPKALGVFLFLAAFAFWGVRPLWDPDEGRYAEVARTMLASGDWLVPHLGDTPHLTKPPVTYWLTAFGLRVFGLNAWGARFSLSVAFLGAILASMELTRCWGWNARETRHAGIVLATSALFFLSGHGLTTDMFLALFETLGILCLWKVWTGAPNTGAWRLGFWTVFGIAFLTKGPPGWIPLSAIVLFHWQYRRDWNRPRIFSWLGIALFLIISSSWYLAVIARDPARFHTFIVDEFINRIATTRHHRNNPFFMYPFIIAGGALPWLWLWPSGWRALREARRIGFRQWGDPARFSAIWFLSGFVIFTLARSRLPLYVVPIFIVVALWEGKLLAGYDWGAPGNCTRWGRSLFPFASAVWLCLMIAVPGLPPQLAFNRSKSKRDMGLRLRHEVDNSNGGARLLWVGRPPPDYSAAFYSRIQMNFLTEKYDEAPVLLAALPRRRDRPLVLLMRASRMDRMSPNAAMMGKLVLEGEYAAVILRQDREHAP